MTQSFHELICGVLATFGRSSSDILHSEGGTYQKCMSDFTGTIVWYGGLSIIFIIVTLLWYKFKKNPTKK